MMWGGGTAPHPTSVKMPNEKVSYLLGEDNGGYRK